MHIPLFSDQSDLPPHKMYPGDDDDDDVVVVAAVAVAVAVVSGGALRMDGWMDGWMHRWMGKSSFC